MGKSKDNHMQAKVLENGERVLMCKNCDALHIIAIDTENFINTLAEMHAFARLHLDCKKKL